jgi:hypothetical protein
MKIFNDIACKLKKLEFKLGTLIEFNGIIFKFNWIHIELKKIGAKNIETHYNDVEKTKK